MVTMGTEIWIHVILCEFCFKDERLLGSQVVQTKSKLSVAMGFSFADITRLFIL